MGDLPQARGAEARGRGRAKAEAETDAIMGWSNDGI